MKNIVLIGIMGCGKTTVAERLGEELKRPVLDTDALIEKDFGPIPKLFEQGEDYFREVESQIISRVSALEGVIISTGGGAVLREENVKALKKNGIIIFIDRPVDFIVKDIDCSGRPLLKNGPEALRSLAEKRYPIYKACCDYHVVSDNDLSHTIQRIVEILRKDGFIGP
ncbi:MAG TPA: shikimate kinase [Thermoclostridium caenicola]|uniref:Shikimate kinase n=1 Tax=Thermoclostridium caenicola TaxID=659425 RepID=A0A1M6EXQ8_9FIRM|nr:shikimate kinase [Thermoclostridium caenicola]SHI90264.1 shikimate kinase [Thermoclostridium caenicola]HOK42608.1 shikimate kinase [Thermoclostridium caenicola]HOL83722.1 shikimate kinase [Thermoclostridium caenicola]HOP72615.1 shikimate kinase [Thermoclostridium caenicola]HPO75699.1 shikimate kinase [Thermoclostridium caenicola]